MTYIWNVMMIVAVAIVIAIIKVCYDMYCFSFTFDGHSEEDIERAALKLASIPILLILELILSIILYYHYFT